MADLVNFLVDTLTLDHEHLSHMREIDIDILFAGHPYAVCFNAAVPSISSCLHTGSTLFLAKIIPIVSR